MSIVGQQRKIDCNVDLVEVGMENWGNVSEIVKSATKVTTLYNKRYIIVFKFIYATFLTNTNNITSILFHKKIFIDLNFILYDDSLFKHHAITQV